MSFNSEVALGELVLKLLFLIIILFAVASFILCVITFSGYFLLIGCIFLLCAWLMRKEFKLTFLQNER